MDEPSVHSFAERLKMSRKEAGLTIREAAEIVGCSDRNYAAYESGETKPSLDKLPLIARGFGVSLDRLILDEHANVDPFVSIRASLSVIEKNIDQIKSQERDRGGFVDPIVANSFEVIAERAVEYFRECKSVGIEPTERGIRTLLESILPVVRSGEVGKAARSDRKKRGGAPEQS